MARRPRLRVARRPHLRPRRAADPLLLAGLCVVARRAEPARDGVHPRDRYGRRLRRLEGTRIAHPPADHMTDHVDPSELRRQYDGPPFDLDDLAPTWLEQFQRW